MNFEFKYTIQINLVWHKKKIYMYAGNFISLIDKPQLAS